LGVVFDPEHLRRVLINLMENARRHASDLPGSIVLRLGVVGGQCVLVVASDGDTIAADVEKHLFEPFFSTRSRGTGLGLYICRELCERYGASIEYFPGDRTAPQRFEFHARAALPARPPSRHEQPWRTACSWSTTSPTCARSTS
jgi:two-component system sensor histidine kinase PilS (NtrC family)